MKNAGLFRRNASAALQIILIGLFFIGQLSAQARRAEFRALKVYAGFADNRTASKNFPSPWQGSPNVKFIGHGPAFNSGAVLLSNPSSEPIVVDSVGVDLRRPGPRWKPATSVTVPAYGTVILTQKLEAHAYPIRECGQPLKQGERRIPWVAITIGGETEFYPDYTHLLDAGGLPETCYRNYSAPWQPLASSAEFDEAAALSAMPARRPATPMLNTIAAVNNMAANMVPGALPADSGTAMTGTITYTYDAVGNRTSMTSTVAAIPGAGVWHYDANDRVTTDGYDAAGNTTMSSGVPDTYDFENHLLTHGGITYTYDGDGNRVSKTVNGVTTNSLVDDQNPTGYPQVLEELQGGQVTRSYTYGLSLISETQLINSKWTTTYYGYDGHGSVRYLTDATGAVTDTYDYDAFGNLISSLGSTPNNYLFAGEQYDPDLGLYYNRARYLDVRIGRFWGMDSFEGDGEAPISLHRYLYASANPVNRRDPSGNEDADLVENLSTNASNLTLQSQVSLNALQAINGVRATLTVAAGLGAKVLSDPNEMEEIAGKGEAGIEVVQRSFLQMETVLTEGEAEATSLGQNWPQARAALNQLYTGAPRPNLPDIEYHHIVEQGGANASRFGSALQSFGNIVPMSDKAHQMVTAFYKSGGFRDWIATQDWNTQWSIGLQIVKQVLQNGVISYTR